MLRWVRELAEGKKVDELRGDEVLLAFEAPVRCLLCWTLEYESEYSGFIELGYFAKLSMGQQHQRRMRVAGECI